eukprot:422293-Pyramimonas_sp.AAC.1
MVDGLPPSPILSRLQACEHGFATPFCRPAIRVLDCTRSSPGLSAPVGRLAIGVLGPRNELGSGLRKSKLASSP